MQPGSPSPLSLAPRALSTLALLALLCACGGAPPSGGSPPPQASVTPLGGVGDAPLDPTSTPAPTASSLATLPEVAEADRLLAEGAYGQATALLTRVYAANRDDPAAQALLAEAYLAWGRATLEASGGDPREVSAALGHFGSGLAVAPGSGQLRGELERERELAAAYVEASAALSDLEQLDRSGADLAQRQTRADELLTSLATIEAQRPDYPGLRELLLPALAAAGEIALQGDQSQEARAARARELCERALALDSQYAPARECLSAVESAERGLDAARQPTAVPGRLVIARVDTSDDPTCISLQIRGTSAAGWSFTVDGLQLPTGRFDGAGNARVCGLGSGQEVTFTVRNQGGGRVAGGSAPARGGDIFVATWRTSP